MGAWGEGMQANDSAMDAIGEHEGDLVKGLTKIIDECLKGDKNDTLYILGLASAIVDENLEMPKAVKNKVTKAIKRELTRDRLSSWMKPSVRKAALNRFHKQLLGKKVSKKLLDRDNMGLMQKIFSTEGNSP
jgi:hypothetical protein